MLLAWREICKSAGMLTDRIEFISAYCDRWCERCAFTNRCSTFAVTAAESMCDGDIGAAIELALGRPRRVEPAREPAPVERLLDQMGDVTVPDREMAAFRKAQQARRARIDREPISQIAQTFTRRAVDWLQAHREPLLPGADPVLREALAVAGWDACLVAAKIHRALSGRDAARRGEMPGHPVQNDWNGSAKVALISLARSESAWRVIDRVTEGQPGVHEGAAVLADAVGHLRRRIESEFPKAMAFIRPGFDG